MKQRYKYIIIPFGPPPKCANPKCNDLVKWCRNTKKYKQYCCRDCVIHLGRPISRTPTPFGPPPKCHNPRCNNLVKWYKYAKRYSKYCCRSCLATGSKLGKPSRYLGKKHSKETRERMSITRKGRPGKPHTDETKAKLSRAQIENHKKGIGNCHSKGKRTLYKGILFKSTWEAKFASQLDEQGIAWRYEEFEFNYYFNGRRIYLPDFFLPYHNIFIEIKPKQLISEKLLAKIAAVRDYGDEIILLTQVNWQNVLDILILGNKVLR